MFKFFYRIFYTLTLFCLKHIKKPAELDVDSLRLQIALENFYDSHSRDQGFKSFNELLGENFKNETVN